MAVKNVLNTYANGTGQLINPGKCSIMFGEASPPVVQETIKGILQIEKDSFEEKYLSFPTPEVRMNKDSSRQRTHWKSWDSLTKPKQCGGMGFREIRLFNQALLARQAWRLLEFLDSLCARVLKAKYYPNGTLVDTTFGGTASPSWKGVEHGLELLKLVWRIGNGKSVHIWRDPWILREFSRKPVTVKGNCRLRWVSELITENGS
ncbi:hypothetical protein OsI_36204 [Oryza sativa Indica Group]|uniref:Retrotransposon protein, putative, unclassified n=1 Tax=Oryza sativa subsp. indica TaxID=39946 RepID=B8BKM9_ORYSI|nr:hypothetical protein OsI_36204 [Oryza sativa Indica Group]